MIERFRYRHSREAAGRPKQAGVETTVRRRLPDWTRDNQLAVAFSILGFIFILTATGGISALGRNLFGSARATGFTETPVEKPLISQNERRSTNSFTFEELDLHPDKVFQPYTAGTFFTGNAGASRALIGQFRSFLDVYVQRQSVDDNFTIRVIDSRTNKTLEVYALEAERRKFEENGTANWDRIDVLRNAATGRLLRKWSDKGYPRAAISTRWGRANQIREARIREEPYIEYEIRLARYLGLSLLSTEIGTVETFNQDRLVSSVGARSRYQLMPYLLKQNDIHKYALRTPAGKLVPVFEEWHPLLTMEPSMKTVRSYTNAVGHEIPGISAYHTGPGNIFAVYRRFFDSGNRFANRDATVMDAYMWAVTEGYPSVSSGTSFKSYSRAYVASAYGALQAMDEEPIDRSKSLRAERVQLRQDNRILLSSMLTVLSDNRSGLDGLKPSENLYTAFRRMNPHFQLPSGTGGAVPVEADVQLTAEAGDVPVRFFLPIGASEVLADAGFDVVDPASIFRYDETTFSIGNEQTEWDRRYEQLVQDVGRFGFSARNKARLIEIKARFEELAASNPSHYRRAQLEIITTHAGIWRTSGFDRLSDLVAAYQGSREATVRPPTASSGR